MCSTQKSHRESSGTVFSLITASKKHNNMISHYWQTLVKAKKVKFAFVFQRPKTQNEPFGSPSLIHSLTHSLAHSFKKENLSGTCYIPGKVFMRKTKHVYFYRACILDQKTLELEESWPVLHTEVSALSPTVLAPSADHHTFPHLCSAAGAARLTGLLVLAPSTAMSVLCYSMPTLY